MKLYAVYHKGCLVDQVPGENEDTALARLKMDRKGYSFDGKLDFVVVDDDHIEEEEITTTSTTVETASEEGEKKQVVIIEADNIQVVINVGEHQIAKEDIEALEVAAETGMVVATRKN